MDLPQPVIEAVARLSEEWCGLVGEDERKVDHVFRGRIEIHNNVFGALPPDP